VIVKSYAKVNLYLEVLAKRKDNYHNIKTIFERISLSDKITLRTRPGTLITINCNNPAVPNDESNLCFRAALLLQDKYRVKKGVDIIIKKHIPVGAGLGGGSSNAAAVLTGLNKLWGLNLNLSRLLNLARKIGCDVPFFVYDVPFALGTARGDKIKPLEKLKKLKLWHVLVFPGIKVSTPLIYKKFDSISGLTRPRYDVKILTSTLAKYPSILSSGWLFNSLEAVTERKYPEVSRIKSSFKNLRPNNALLMSGSGPTVFSLARSRQEALLLKKVIQTRHKSWEVFLAGTC
jgi:4-diphosphocytidyl-2-C-methyl-D-erythritol kinase